MLLRPPLPVVIVVPPPPVPRWLVIRATNAARTGSGYWSYGLLENSAVDGWYIQVSYNTITSPTAAVERTLSLRKYVGGILVDGTSFADAAFTSTSWGGDGTDAVFRVAFDLDAIRDEILLRDSMALGVGFGWVTSIAGSVSTTGLVNSAWASEDPDDSPTPDCAVVMASPWINNFKTVVGLFWKFDTGITSCPLEVP